MEIDFKKSEFGKNEVLTINDNCYVSFRKGEDFCFLKDNWNSDNHSDETAIVITIQGMEIFKILNGDFRKECIEIVKNGGEEKELLELYKKHPELHSSWSNK